MQAQFSISRKRSSSYRKTPRSTIIWVMPTGKAGVRPRRGINGAEPCSSARRRTTSSQSKPNSMAVPCPPGRVAVDIALPVTVFAPAKVNLYLHVTGRRPDGYHLVDSLVAFADIGDWVTATPAA